jgi:ABC-type branched-subunit amino acid transport system substrate-binding protein
MFSARRRVKAVFAIGALLAITACGASPAVERAIATRNARATGASGAGGSGGTALAGSTDAGGSAGGTAGGASGSASGAAASGGINGGGAAAGGATTGAKAGGPASGRNGTFAVGVAGGCGAQAPAGGNGGSTDTGVSGSTIKVGGTFFNGGYLDKYSQVTENAAKAYFNFVNDQGGICGRKIQFDTCDTGGNADGTVGCLTKLADQDNVFTMGPSLDFNLDIVQPFLASHKLPWVGDSGLYDAEFQSPWMFPTQIPGFDVGALIATQAIQTLHAKKIGISLLNTVAGPQCTAKAQQVAQKLGVDASATAANPEVVSLLDSQVGTLKQAGVDTVLFCNDPVNTIKFIQAAQRVGWKPTFVGGFVAADDVPLAAGSDAVGMYGFTAYDFYKAATAGIKQYLQITEYYYPNTFHHFYEQAAYIGAEALVAALRATGPNLKRDAFLKALKSMTDFDTGMGLHLNFANLSAQSPSGILLQADGNLAWHVVSGRFSPAA